MKSVTVRQAEEDFGKVLRLVKSGQEVELLERKRVIARIIPVPSEDQTVDWSDVRTRLRTIWKGKVVGGKPASQIIIDDRR